jgi:hypothetical protein
MAEQGRGIVKMRHEAKASINSLKFRLMENQSQLDRIKAKLGTLIKADPGNTIFGAAQHFYKPNAPKKEAEVAFFEKRYGIQLPSGYREYLLTIGNGGVGPYYGLQRLEAACNADLDHPKPELQLDPSKPFPNTDAWNMEAPAAGTPEQQAAFEAEYASTKWADGLLRLANYGCGMSLNLVVNGPDYGKVWMDARINDGGIYPDHLFGNAQKVGFLDWYELWLDSSLKEVAGTGHRATDA